MPLSVRFRWWEWGLRVSLVTPVPSSQVGGDGGVSDADDPASPAERGHPSTLNETLGGPDGAAKDRGGFRDGVEIAGRDACGGE